MIKLTEKIWDQISKINYEINTEIFYESDMDRFGKLEYWSEEGADCEDYALRKRKKLLEQGFMAGDLRMATCMTEGRFGEVGKGDYHAVLIIDTDKGQFVLDNRYPFTIMSLDKLPYRWVMMQDCFGKWREIEGVE